MCVNFKLYFHLTHIINTSLMFYAFNRIESHHRLGFTLINTTWTVMSRLVICVAGKHRLSLNFLWIFIEYLLIVFLFSNAKALIYTRNVDLGNTFNFGTTCRIYYVSVRHVFMYVWICHIFEKPSNCFDYLKYTWIVFIVKCVGLFLF